MSRPQRQSTPSRNADWRADQGHLWFVILPTQQVTPELIAQSVARVPARVRWSDANSHAVLKFRKANGRPAALDNVPLHSHREVLDLLRLPPWDGS